MRLLFFRKDSDDQDMEDEVAKMENVVKSFNEAGSK